MLDPGFKTLFLDILGGFCKPSKVRGQYPAFEGCIGGVPSLHWKGCVCVQHHLTPCKLWTMRSGSYRPSLDSPRLSELWPSLEDNIQAPGADQHALSLQIQGQRPVLRPRSRPAGRSQLASTTSPAWPRPPAHPLPPPMALELRRHLAPHPLPRPCPHAQPRCRSVHAAAATAQSTCWRLHPEPRRSPRTPRWAALVLWRISTPFTSCHAFYPRVSRTSQQAKNTCCLSCLPTAWLVHDGQQHLTNG